MIIDSHAYCFEALDSPRGYSSGEEHLQWAQAANASHHQPAMRIPDGEIGPSDVLDPAGTHDIDNLPDLRFRVNKPRGRVVWNWEGREYTKYFLPPNLRNTEFTPFSLDSEMHYAGVEASSCTPTRPSCATARTCRRSSSAFRAGCSPWPRSTSGASSRRPTP